MTSSLSEEPHSQLSRFSRHSAVRTDVTRFSAPVLHDGPAAHSNLRLASDGPYERMTIARSEVHPIRGQGYLEESQSYPGDSAAASPGNAQRDTTGKRWWADGRDPEIRLFVHSRPSVPAFLGVTRKANPFGTVTRYPGSTMQLSEQHMPLVTRWMNVIRQTVRQCVVLE